MGGVISVNADDTAYCYYAIDDTTYAIPYDSATVIYNAFTSAYPSQGAGSTYLCYPAEADMYSGDYITITAADASLVYLSKYSSTNRSYYGDDSSTLPECGYAVLGTSISNNSLTESTEILAVDSIIYGGASSDNAWQSIISVTPKTTGTLGFKAAHTSSRSAGLYDLTDHEWLGIGNDQGVAVYITGAATAGHEYLIVGDGTGHYMYAITFVPEVERTISAGYASFSATYNVTKPEGVTAYTGTYNSTYNCITLTEYDGDVLPANTGFILASESDGTIVLEATSQTAEAPTGNELVATGDNGYTALSTTYGLGTDGIFYKAKEGTTVKPNRAVINISSSSSAVTMSVIDTDSDSETTAISNAVNTTPTQGDGIYYNLAGQRVSQPAEGIYIRNGKKIIIK